MSYEFLFPALATMLALTVYYSQMIFVGWARGKYNIKAPKTTGDDNFERVFRAHYNTLEQLPIFIIPLWFFALLISPYWAGWLGVIWSIGRIAYVVGYYKSANKRNNYISMLSSLVVMVLILGSFWKIIANML